VLTLGSVERTQAAEWFPFLAERFHGRRKALREFTHTAPEFVFWIYPDGTLFDAKDAHRKNVPRGYEHILDDEPDYGGFLRGRVARRFDHQIVVVYCPPEALASPGPHVEQLLSGLSKLPVPVDDDALICSDNCDIYGTYVDLIERSRSE
jgi:hypothetical protein